jgi:hypothetical protein
LPTFDQNYNANYDEAMFAAERALDSLATAGYQNGFEGLSLSKHLPQEVTEARVPAALICAADLQAATEQS